MSEFDIDVALSFSGAQRAYVGEVATALQDWAPRTFFDQDQSIEVEMWGTDLNEYLRDVYGRRSRFIVMFVSAEYAAAAFPTAERRAAFEAAMHGSSIVLPVRFDDTEVPGLGRNVHYLQAADHTPAELAEKIAKKLESEGVPVRRPTTGAVTLIPRAGATDAATVTVSDDQGRPLDGCEVALVAANGNVVVAERSAVGRYTAAVPRRRLMDLWVAHPSHRALRIVNLDTAQDIAATMGRAAGTGSSLFRGSTGHIPPIRGRFNPIRDGARCYVYIDNAAVNDHPARPATFQPGRPFEVEDVDGTVVVVTIVETTGNGSLIEWKQAPRDGAS